MNDDAIILEHMAKVGYERFYDEKWLVLPSNRIERALWIEIAKAMLKKARLFGGVNAT